MNISNKIFFFKKKNIHTHTLKFYMREGNQLFKHLNIEIKGHGILNLDLAQ